MQKGLGAIYILVGVLILGLVAGGAYYFGKSSTPKSSPTPIVSQTPSPSSTPDETANWKTYTNNNLGYSLKLPVLVSHFNGSCVYISSPNAGESSYRPESAMVPVKVFEDGNSTYISSQYYYHLGGERQMSGVSFFDKCNKVDNSLELLRSYFSNYSNNFEEVAWKIDITNVSSNDDLNSYITKRFGGPDCTIEKQPQQQDGVDEVFVNTPDSVQVGHCTGGGKYVLEYYSAKHKIASWALGQACAFSQDIEDGNKCLDLEIANSFRFTQ